MNDDKSSDGRLLVAGIDYLCRICESRQTIYVKPLLRSGKVTLDFDGHHRIVRHQCENCNQSRTHVATQTLPDRFLQTQSEEEGLS